MTALTQFSAGLALASCFAILGTRQAGTSMALLFLQSMAVTVCTFASGCIELAPMPLLLTVGIWAIYYRSADVVTLRSPGGSSRLVMTIGAGLTVLSQSQGTMAESLAILLSGVLLAATRSQPFAQATALVVGQNAVLLLVCQSFEHPALPVTWLLLLIPAVALLLFGCPRIGRAKLIGRYADWMGRGRIAVSCGILLLTLIIPLDPLSVVFAPLFALDGVIRAWAERRRLAMAPLGHLMALTRLAAILAAVMATEPVSAWAAITVAMATAVLPSRERRLTSVNLALYGATFALFGFLGLMLDHIAVACLALIAGFTTMAAIVPELAAPLVVLVLRLSNTPVWADVAAWVCTVTAVGGLLACAALLWLLAETHRAALLHLAQAAVALLTVGLNNAEGRYAGMMLLVLLTLTRAASRFGSEPAAVIARFGLTGMSPVGVFPALVLVILALSGHDPWLLVPLGVALTLIVLNSFPARLPTFIGREQILSPAWLPLALAVVVGFLTPAPFAHWLHVVTASPS